MQKKIKSFQLCEDKRAKKMKSFQLFEEKKVKTLQKMKSFQLFKNKNAKDWKESLQDGANFFQKNRQLILVFLLGLVTFPVLFFLTVSLSKATTSLVGTMGCSEKKTVQSRPPSHPDVMNSFKGRR